MADLLASLAARKANESHSIFSPSSAKRWTSCPGSLLVNALADDRTSIYAAEGTVAHAIADEWLRTGVRPAVQKRSADGYEFEVDDAMLAYVEQYVDWVHDTPGVPYYEQRVDFSALTPIPYQRGTVDNANLSFGWLRIKDFKYGKGIRVDVVDSDGKPNAQLALYAAAVFLEWDWYYDFQKIELAVCQPRLDHMPSVVITRAELLEFMAWIKEKAVEAWRLDAPRSPGVHCWQCAAERSCPAHLAWLNSVRDTEADDVFGLPALRAATERAEDWFEPVIDLPELSIEACCRVLAMRGTVESWFGAIEQRVFAAAQNGDAPGWKIVEGRANRDWVDEAEAKERMVEVGIPMSETETRKLRSPNQAEEWLHAETRMPKKKAAELFDSLTERKPGVLSLVRSHDRREAVPLHGSVFDED